MVVGITRVVNTRAGSFELDPGIEYDLAPLRDFAIYARRKFGRTAGDDFKSLACEQVLHLWSGQAARGIFVHLPDDVGRRARWREQAKPQNRFIARIAGFSHGRHFRRDRRTPEAADGERA